MNLTRAIDLYVERRHAEGSTYVNGESVLRSICRQLGDIPLEQVTSLSLSKSIYNPRCSAITCRGKYSMVRRFLTYWSVRGEAPNINLRLPAKAEASFVPYVYSECQIGAILSASEAVQRGSRIASGSTIRMYLLTLYATGGTPNEVLQICSSHVILDQSQLLLQGNQRTCRRVIPICCDLCQELRHYLSGGSGWRTDGEGKIFTSSMGKQLTRNYLRECFLKLLREAGVARMDGVSRSPRMQDFRVTFAVHRIQTWLKEGADLNRLLPSLSAYMGYTSLCATQKYLRLAPDFLRPDIEKLSKG